MIIRSLLLSCLVSLAAAAEPALNLAFAKRALDFSTNAVTTAQSGLEAAKLAASTPLGGSKAKARVEQAQGKLDTATALKSDFALLADGKAPAKDGLLTKLTSASDPNAKSGIMERIKALPGAEMVVSALATPGVPEALIAMTPLDQVPGLPAAVSALAAAK